MCRELSEIHAALMPAAHAHALIATTMAVGFLISRANAIVAGRL
jgi:hypothetical protein